MEIEQQGMVRRYEAEGRTLLCIPHFLRHQVISHPSVSKLPPPSDGHGSEKGTGTVTEHSEKGTGTVTPELNGRERKGKNLPVSSLTTGTDQNVFEIAKAYPKLSHLNSEMEISPIVLQRIIAAIEADGADKVLQGTKAYAAQLKDREFALAPEKFFGMFEYRAHAERPTNKSPWGGNPADRLREELGMPPKCQ